MQAARRSGSYGDRADRDARGHELQLNRQQPSGRVPAVAAVEELPPPRTKRGKDMLQIRGRCGERTERRRMKGPATERKHAHSGEPTGDLERAIRDVAMRDAIGKQMERDAE